MEDTGPAGVGGASPLRCVDCGTPTSLAVLDLDELRWTPLCMGCIAVRYSVHAPKIVEP